MGNFDLLSLASGEYLFGGFPLLCLKGNTYSMRVFKSEVYGRSVEELTLRLFSVGDSERVVPERPLSCLLEVEAVPEKPLCIKKAGSLGTGKFAISLLSITTTFDMVGRNKRRKNKSKEGSTCVSNGDTDKEIGLAIRIFLLKILKNIRPDQAHIDARLSVPSLIDSPLHKGISLAWAVIETLLSAFCFTLNRKFIFLLPNSHHLQPQEGVILPTYGRASAATTREISIPPTFRFSLIFIPERNVSVGYAKLCHRIVVRRVLLLSPKTKFPESRSLASLYAGFDVDSRSVDQFPSSVIAKPAPTSTSGLFRLATQTTIRGLDL
ncbi:hypothetical protein SADUNF_Sadunf19G0110400 [Salix dunnii]|uniref:Uncharacterized protein n=1 Tax=Salix dunnii TaxID=1413687 RepID=A0A835MLI6_9ROSI|nr:hypothetical protein SADUNF_Sadunf19G0110400 [Salix dunnii]